MKSILSLLIIVAGLASVNGQGLGLVDFSNTGTFSTIADRSVYIGQIGGAKLTGTNYVAALYFGTAGLADINQLAVKSLDDQSLLSAVGHFRDVDPFISSAGTWVGGIRVLPGTTVGQSLFMQVRIWDMNLFATFEASVAGGGPFAQSSAFSYLVPSPNDSAGLKIEGFRGIGAMVPEPGTFLLSAVGIGGLLVLRRRTRS